MDWVKYGRARLKEQELEEVKLLKDHLFKDEKKTFDAITHISHRPEWKDFLETLDRNLNKEFIDI